MTPAVLTVTEAADLARCSTADIAGLVAAGAVPHLVLGDTTVIPAGAFTTWLDDQALTLWRLHTQLAAAGVHLGGLR